MVSSAEFTEWQGFYELEPWGGAVENWRAAMIGQAVVNTAGKMVKRPVPLADFLPKLRPAKQTREHVLAALRAASGG